VHAVASMAQVARVAEAVRDMAHRPRA